jgi:hypothetical protein
MNNGDLESRLQQLEENTTDLRSRLKILEKSVAELMEGRIDFSLERHTKFLAEKLSQLKSMIPKWWMAIVDENKANASLLKNFMCSCKDYDEAPSKTVQLNGGWTVYLTNFMSPGVFTPIVVHKMFTIMQDGVIVSVYNCKELPGEDCINNAINIALTINFGAVRAA